LVVRTLVNNSRAVMTIESPNASDAASEFSAAVQAVPLLGFVAIATVGGALLGAATNAITAYFAPDYFRVVLGWWDIQDLWRAAIAEGVFAGLLTGFFGGLLFALVIGLATGCRVGLNALARAILLAGMTAMVGWVCGGLIGIGIAHLSPERIEGMFVVPDGYTFDFDPTSFGWAGGSIVGLWLGALAGAVVAAVRIRARWKLVQAAEQATRAAE